MKGQAKRHNGHMAYRLFTLVELLVVIAIISILAAMLLPALEKARESAQSAYCINNLKQMFLGLNEYAEEYQGYYPYGANSDAYYITHPWSVGIQPYLATPRIFACPSDPWLNMASWGSHRSYKANRGNDSKHPGDKAGVMWWGGSCRWSDVDSPSQTVTIFDGWVESSLQIWQYSAFAVDWLAFTNANDFHGKWRNFLCADGHAANLSRGEVFFDNGNMMTRDGSD